MSVATLSGYAPRRRFDGKAWISARIEGAADSAGPWSTIETFNFTDPDVDPSEPAVRNFTTELVDTAIHKWLRVVFLDEDGDQDATDPLALSATGSLARLSQVETRMGRDLTDKEITQATFLIGLATTNIIAALDRDPLTWVAPAKAKPFLTMMCIELVCRSMPNPEGLSQKSETIGSYSYTTTYGRGQPGSRDFPGLMLTAAEELTVRRVVFGSNTASVKVESQADEYADMYYVAAPLEWAMYYGPSLEEFELEQIH